MSRRDALRASAIGGVIAGVAMMPVGMILRASGHRVNVYGELLVRSLLGAAPMWAQLILHLAISVGMALPFGIAMYRRASARTTVIAGALFGVASWALVNASLLPLWFGRATAWELGARASIPSLTVHVVYGLVLGVVTRHRGAAIQNV